MGTWTPEALHDAATLSINEFVAKYRDEFTRTAIIIKRRELRDMGIEVVPSPIGRRPDPIVIHMPELPADASDQEFWDAYIAMYDVQKKHDDSKALANAAITIETDHPVGIVFISDMHLGSKGVDIRRLLQDIQLIQSCDRLRVYMGGDWVDNFVNGKLLSVHRDESLLTSDMQWNGFARIMRSLAPQLLAVGSGNHDAWTKKASGLDPDLSVLAQVPVLYTGERCYLDLTVGEQQYVIYRKHRPTRTTQNNHGHGIQHAWRFGERPFDVGVEEHHHTPHISTFEGHGQTRYAVRTGSYKIRDAHAAEFGHTNGGIGTPVLVFYPFHREIVHFETITAAIEFLDP